MRVAFRTDASSAIGAGHLSRCASLADQLAQQGDETHFVVGQADALVASVLAGRPHRLSVLGLGPDAAPESDAEASAQAIGGTADWLVVDHYGLDRRWEAQLAAQVGRLLVLDDLADRPHDCDVLVDPGEGRSRSDYKGLLPARCEPLLGPRYALLRLGFAAWHGRARDDAAHARIHVFFGSGETSRRWLPVYCERLLEAFSRIEIEAVGQADPAVMQSLQGRFAPRLAWHARVKDMAAHMASCSVAFGGPGSATWERACVGLPMALVATADNQPPVLRRLADAGFACYFGPAAEVGDHAFIDAVASFLGDRDRLAALRARGVAAVDGRGAARVAERMRRCRS